MCHIINVLDGLQILRKHDEHGGPNDSSPPHRTEKCKTAAVLLSTQTPEPPGLFSNSRVGVQSLLGSTAQQVPLLQC